ncbi:MAG: hypothetical protein CME64_07365 [Halobacteriovoraceae bacterium]|nr:hypothetical protein [Halobacteriovoraceae bacterium]|tara:strand:- start:27334 stop:28080 length:747 start_codon:yes stop_codon:yes gene_type:complete
MKNLLVFIVSFAIIGCATKRVEEHSQSELNHFVLSIALVGPAIQNAIGSIKQDTLKSASHNLSVEDTQKLILISKKAFSPLKAYKRVHARALQTISREDTVSIAKKLNEDSYREFSEKLIELYKNEGYSKVVKAMKDLDEEKMTLDMEKAILAEKISRHSMNFNVLKILFNKMGNGSKVEELLYRQSMFVLTYLAIEDMDQSEIEGILRVRQDPTWSKYQKAFEQSIGQSYDEFFFELRKYNESKFSS